MNNYDNHGNNNNRDPLGDEQQQLSEASDRTRLVTRIINWPLIGFGRMEGMKVLNVPFCERVFCLSSRKSVEHLAQCAPLSVLEENLSPLH